MRKTISVLIGEDVGAVFGICDADFDNLDGKRDEYIRTCIFPTDTHDIEMMMFDSPSLNAFIDEYSNDDNHAEIQNCIKSSILSSAYSIGLVRMINCENDLKLNFKKMNFKLFANVRKLVIDINMQKFADHLIARSPNKVDKACREFVLEEYEKYEKMNKDIFQVCCGHDVTSLISQVYSQKWASVDTNMNQKKVESSLRIGYVLEHFSKTELHRLIHDWSLEKKISLLPRSQ